MHFQPFKLERYFAKYEFKVDYLLSASDCESLTIQELLQEAEQQDREAWERLPLGYTESNGHPGLRAEISRLYPGLGPDKLLVTTPEEGIFIMLNTLLRRGDHVVVIQPAYQSLREIPKSIGCSVTDWPLSAKGKRWSLDLDLLERSIRKNTKLLVINFPHNPTGFLPDRGSLRQIIALARRHQLYLFSDEMYWLLEYEPSRRLEPVASLYEKGISLFGLSKSFGLPGLRIGWLATQDPKLLRGFSVVRDYTTICSSAPSEMLALMALKAKDRLIKRNLKIIQSNLALAEGFFSSYPQWFTWLPPQAGSVALPKLSKDIPVEELCEKLAREKSVMLLPGTIFDVPGNHFRLGLGRMNLEAGFQRLEEYLKEAF